MCQFNFASVCHKIDISYFYQGSCMSKTKSVRIKLDDAFLLEQTARELSAELQEVVKVSAIIEELVKEVEVAKERIKTRIKQASEK